MQETLFDESTLDFAPTGEEVDEREVIILPNPTGELSLCEVSIKNFKKCKDCTVTLPNIAVLTGVNNSGKSTVLHAISLAFEVLKSCYESKTGTISKTGRTKKELDSVPSNENRDLWTDRLVQTEKVVSIEVGLKFTNGFYFKANIRRLYGFLNIKISDYKPDATKQEILEVIALDPVYVSGNVGVLPHEVPVHKSILTKQLGQGLVSGFLRNLLCDLHEKQTPEYETIVNVLETWLGITLKSASVNENETELRVEYIEDKLSLDLVSAGSGFHQLLQIAALLYFRKGRLLLLDEPDAHLHYSLQRQLHGILNDLSEALKVQTIIVTHSPALISNSDPNQIVPIDFSKTLLGPIKATEDHLAELVRISDSSNFELAVLYQSRRVLFVEGKSEIEAMPFFDQVFGKSLFSGPTPIVAIKFDGTGNIRATRRSVELFEQIIGGSLRYKIIRDLDWMLPTVEDLYIKSVSEASLESQFQLIRIFDLDNLLCNPEVLDRAANALSPGTISLSEIQEIVSSASLKVLEEDRTKFASQSRILARNLLKDLSDIGQIESKIDDEGFTLYEELKNDPEARRCRVDGKRILGKTRDILQNQFKINLRSEKIWQHLTKSDLPQELHDILISFDAP